jgi:hypothetical protein
MNYFSLDSWTRLRVIWVKEVLMHWCKKYILTTHKPESTVKIHGVKPNSPRLFIYLFFFWPWNWNTAWPFKSMISCYALCIIKKKKRKTLAQVKFDRAIICFDSKISLFCASLFSENFAEANTPFDTEILCTVLRWMMSGLKPPLGTANFYNHESHERLNLIWFFFSILIFCIKSFFFVSNQSQPTNKNSYHNSDTEIVRYSLYNERYTLLTRVSSLQGIMLGSVSNSTFQCLRI